jgi:formamidopyrimidine-DNA glycosylase
MPELPEVETIARDLDAAIVGATVTAVWGSGLPLHLKRAVDLVGIRRLSVGRRIARVGRKGKYLLLAFERGTERAELAAAGVVAHLGMSGRFRVEPATAARARHTHVVFTLNDERELRFVDPRRFGWMAPSSPLHARPELMALGPDPLTELDEAELARRLVGARAPIKAFLLDQRRIAGLGNIYVSEALHRARIHPTMPAGQIVGQATALLAGIRASLELGIRNRGTTLRDYVDANGARGDNAASLRVYGREGEPCPVCASSIQRRVDAGRSTFFCPVCQRRGGARGATIRRTKAKEAR